MPWTVTKQFSWPDGNLIVEISSGGIDFCNPDALWQKYPGEFEDFEDPREAVETAIKIAKYWQSDLPDETIYIGRGATGGMTMPFDPLPLEEGVFLGLRQWADERYAKLPKCDECWGILPEDPHKCWKIHTWPELFCSECCCDLFAARMREETEAWEAKRQGCANRSGEAPIGELEDRDER